MESIVSFLQALYQSPHYSFGWLVLAGLALLPAIVSANLIQHDLSKLIRNKSETKKLLVLILKNTIILMISISVISYAFYLYFWK